MSFRRLPVELYLPIIQCFLPCRRTVCALCTVSRTFQLEAERVLYRSVRLPSEPPRILSWCLMMVESPRRSALVYTMFLPTRTAVMMTDSELHDLQQILSRSLSLLINLEELRSYGSGSNPLMRYLAPWMFKDCSFRLRTFFVAGWIIANLTEDEWLRFLGQQRKIERCDMRWMFLLPNIRWWTDVFSQRSGNQDGSLQILPYLSTAKIQDWNMLQLLYPRALVHLQLTVGPDSMTRSSIDMFATNLKAVQTTLTHISFHMRNYSWEVPDDWSVANVLAVIAKSTLGLKFLEFSAVKEPMLLCTPTQLAASLSQFHHLQSLFIHPLWDNMRPFWDLNSLDQCYIAAERLMLACPSLARLSFPVKDAWIKRRCVSGPFGRCPCYLRPPPSGEITLEGYNLIDGDSWQKKLTT